MNNFISDKIKEFDEKAKKKGMGGLARLFVKSFFAPALQEAYSAGLADRDDAVMTGMKLAKSQSLQERVLEEKLKEE